MNQNMLVRSLIALVKLYQVAFSRKRPCCRYVPTCSNYAVEALSKYGSLKGSYLMLKRILRCRPGFQKYSNCGYDPVP